MIPMGTENRIAYGFLQWILRLIPLVELVNRSNPACLVELAARLYRLLVLVNLSNQAKGLIRNFQLTRTQYLIFVHFVVV